MRTNDWPVTVSDVAGAGVREYTVHSPQDTDRVLYIAGFAVMSCHDAPAPTSFPPIPAR